MTLMVSGPTGAFLTFLQREGYQYKVLATARIPFQRDKVPTLIEVPNYRLGSFSGIVGLRMQEATHNFVLAWGKKENQN